MTETKRTWRRWTVEEDRLVVDARVPRREIAARLGRSEMSVSGRRWYLSGGGDAMLMRACLRHARGDEALALELAAAARAGKWDWKWGHRR